MRLLINNKATADLTIVNGENLRFPKQNMYADQLVIKTLFNTNIDIDFTQAIKVTAFAYAGNLDTLTLKAGTTSSVLDYSNALTNLVADGKTINHLFLNETYQYWQLLDPAGSPVDQFCNYFYLGEYYQLPNPEYGSTPELENTDKETITQSGQVYTTEGILRKVQDFDFPFVTQEQKDEFELWWNSSDRINPHLFMQTENNTTLFPPYFAKIKKYRLRDRKLSEPKYRISFEVEEAK